MFKEIIGHITRNYSVQQYQRLTRDRRLENVPHTLKKLWRSEDSRVIDVGTMDVFYLLYRSGLIPEAEFTAMLTGLESALAHEFELFYTAKANTEERRPR